MTGLGIPKHLLIKFKKIKLALKTQLDKMQKSPSQLNENTNCRTWLGNYTKRYMNPMGAEIITVDADQSKNPNFVEPNGNRSTSQFDTAHICTPKQNTFCFGKKIVLTSQKIVSLKSPVYKMLPNGQHLHMTRKQSM